MPVMDKLEEISSGKKEAAPAAENDATSVGEGRSLLPRPGLPTPGEAAVPARETTAGIREDVAAVNMNVDRPLRVSTETEMTLLLSRRYRHLARGHPHRAAPSALVRRGTGFVAGTCP